MRGEIKLIERNKGREIEKEIGQINIINQTCPIKKRENRL